VLGRLLRLKFSGNRESWWLNLPLMTGAVSVGLNWREAEEALFMYWEPK